MVASKSSFTSLLIGLVPEFVVVFILDVFVIGMLARKIAFKLPVNPESKIQVILTISCLMVLGMVTCMSLFGVIVERGIPDQLFSAYMNAQRMNVIAALPLQLIVVDPLSRNVLGAIQSNEQWNTVCLKKRL